MIVLANVGVASRLSEGYPLIKGNFSENRFTDWASTRSVRWYYVSLSWKCRYSCFWSTKQILFSTNHHSSNICSLEPMFSDVLAIRAKVEVLVWVVVGVSPRTDFRLLSHSIFCFNLSAHSSAGRRDISLSNLANGVWKPWKRFDSYLISSAKSAEVCGTPCICNRWPRVTVSLGISDFLASLAFAFSFAMAAAWVACSSCSEAAGWFSSAFCFFAGVGLPFFSFFDLSL